MSEEPPDDGFGDDTGSEGSVAAEAPEPSSDHIHPEQPNQPAPSQHLPTPTESAAEERNLFVAGLTPSMREPELAALFQRFGELLSVKVLLDIYTGESRGCGFVLFATRESALRALQETVKPLTAKIAEPRARMQGHPTRKLFLRNLPLQVSEGDIRRLLSGDQARVIQVTLRRDPQTQNPPPGRRVPETNVAHIVFDSVQQASEAASALHGAKPWICCDVPLLAKVVDTGMRARKQKKAKADRREERLLLQLGSSPTFAQPPPPSFAASQHPLASYPPHLYSTAPAVSTVFAVPVPMMPATVLSPAPTFLNAPMPEATFAVPYGYLPPGSVPYFPPTASTPPVLASPSLWPSSSAPSSQPNLPILPTPSFPNPPVLPGWGAGAGVGPTGPWAAHDPYARRR